MLPGRWQVWQFFCKIGSTSLLKVMSPPNASATNNEPTANKGNLMGPSPMWPYRFNLTPPDRRVKLGEHSAPERRGRGNGSEQAADWRGCGNAEGGVTRDKQRPAVLAVHNGRGPLPGAR